MKELQTLDLATITPASLAQRLADCPECEYCCAIGLCCPPLQQTLALMAILVRDTGCSVAEAHKYALPIVTARVKANKA
jgi:hypothetical protein